MHGMPFYTPLTFTVGWWWDLRWYVACRRAIVFRWHLVMLAIDTCSWSTHKTLLYMLACEASAGRVRTRHTPHRIYSRIYCIQFSKDLCACTLCLRYHHTWKISPLQLPNNDHPCRPQMMRRAKLTVHIGCHAEPAFKASDYSLWQVCNGLRELEVLCQLECTPTYLRMWCLGIISWPNVYMLKRDVYVSTGQQAKPQCCRFLFIRTSAQ